MKKGDQVFFRQRLAAGQGNRVLIGEIVAFADETHAIVNFGRASSAGGPPVSRRTINLEDLELVKNRYPGRVRVQQDPLRRMF